MRRRAFACLFILPLVAVAVTFTNPSSAMAQTAAGVAVDAQGVLRMQTYADPGGQLARQRVAAAKASLSTDVARFRDIIYISLNRLEEAVIDRQGVPTDEMRYLAGLLRVKYVFFFPESKDIVIAGPAEGWVTNPAGRVVGLKSGRPIVPLQDLVVALRAFAPGEKATGLIGCSIDPTEEGLAAMQRFLRSVGSTLPRSDAQYIRHIVNGLQTSLGLQEVSINGVSPNTHFAQVLVEADYRMKLIGIGLERPPVAISSFVKYATPAQVSRNALQRWFFTPDYECVRVSEDGLAMELVGDGVKLVGEDEMVTRGGQRVISRQSNRASRMFVTGFTKKYAELADRSPVYAELRNLVDLSIAAAHIQQEDYYQRAGWKMKFFGNEKAFAVETYNAPKQVATAVTAVRKGGKLMTPIGGGVTIQARQALDSENLLDDENQKVEKLRKQIKINLAKGQWWWN